MHRGTLQRSDWPLAADRLHQVIEQGETTLVEFKRAWWGAEAPDGRAKIARVVLALANSVGRDDLGLLIIGVDDDRRGGSICSVVDPPSPEAVSQVLQGLIQPPASIECRHYDLKDGMVSAVAVFHSAVRPHVAVREVPGILSTREVYVRRDRQVGMMTVAELQRMIRDQDAAPQRTRDPILFGFGGTDRNHPPGVVLRVQNVLAEPVAGVSVILDVFLMADRSMCGRSRPLSETTLAPGASIELTVRASELHMWKLHYAGDPPKSELLHMGDASRVTDRSLDLVAHVTFRDADGFIQQRDAAYTMAW